MCSQVPTLEEVGVTENLVPAHQKRKFFGGETVALEQLALRLKVEKDSFDKGFYLPLQVRPDLFAPPLSMSAAIALGAISVRL